MRVFLGNNIKLIKKVKLPFGLASTIGVGASAEGPRRDVPGIYVALEDFCKSKVSSERTQTCVY